MVIATAHITAEHGSFNRIGQVALTDGYAIGMSAKNRTFSRSRYDHDDSTLFKH